MTASTTGANLVAGSEATAGRATIHGMDVRRGEPLEPAAHEATDHEVDRACAAAAEAAEELTRWTPDELARLLAAVADELEADGDAIVSAADTETALGAEPRLTGELARTTGQLRFLGEVVRDGAHLEATIDHRAAGPDLRRVRVPVGPVAVFGASNFPLAFSVAGGDTAAALATGCPAVVKAHPSHPATSELVGRAVTRGVAAAGAPPGAFSLLHGFEAGRRLVLDRRIAAVAFTGSRAGGESLAELSRQREHPIPVYAEMGSLNPVVVTPGAAAARTDEIAEGFVESFTLGAGQFCTKPGLLFVPTDSDLPARIADQVTDRSAAPLLNEAVSSAWRERSATWADHPAVDRLAGHAPSGNGDAPAGDTLRAAPLALTVDATDLGAHDELLEECFGPTSLVVRWRELDELEAGLDPIRGSLAGGIHAADDEPELTRRLVELLTPRVGRLLFDGWPTGVAVTWAMQHGGPRPATTAPRDTSVGAAAVDRFLRPICYQGAPAAVLPPSLRDDNPLGLPRRVDGALQLPGGPAAGA